MNWLDQTLHFIIGLLIVSGLMFVVPWYAAVFVSLLGATAREMLQHPWACHDGCRTDLLFWALGSLVGVVLYKIFESRWL